jgi:hypothetical protein
MRTLSKYVVTAALTGALALAAATPTQARWYGHHGGWHHGGGAAAAAIGFGAGALLGAAAASAAYPGYYYGPGYYDYGYSPAPEAYDGGPVYVQPAPSSCWHSTDSDRGYGYYGSCY